MLTENLILQKTKQHDLRHVKKLNVCGIQLNDISILRDLPNLEVCSLSVNRVSSLEPLSHCRSLQELYLRKNNISDLGEVFYLSQLPRLQYLWLSENPCCSSKDYRKLVVQACPHLIKLDDQLVSDDERKQRSVSPTIASHVVVESKASSPSRNNSRGAGVRPSTSHPITSSSHNVHTKYVDPTDFTGRGMREQARGYHPEDDKLQQQPTSSSHALPPRSGGVGGRSGTNSYEEEREDKHVMMHAKQQQVHRRDMVSDYDTSNQRERNRGRGDDFLPPPPPPPQPAHQHQQPLRQNRYDDPPNSHGGIMAPPPPPSKPQHSVVYEAPPPPTSHGEHHNHHNHNNNPTAIQYGKPSVTPTTAPPTNTNNNVGPREDQVLRATLLLLRELSSASLSVVKSYIDERERGGSGR